MVPWVWPWRRGGGPPTMNQLCSQVFWGECAPHGCSGLVPGYFEVAASLEAEVKGVYGSISLFILIVVMIILHRKVFHSHCFHCHILLW